LWFDITPCDISVEEPEAAFDDTTGNQETKRLPAVGLLRLSTSERRLYRRSRSGSIRANKRVLGSRSESTVWRRLRPTGVDDSTRSAVSSRRVQCSIFSASRPETVKGHRSTWQTPRPQPPAVDEDELTEFYESGKFWTDRSLMSILPLRSITRGKRTVVTCPVVVSTRWAS